MNPAVCVLILFLIHFSIGIPVWKRSNDIGDTEMMNPNIDVPSLDFRNTRNTRKVGKRQSLPEERLMQLILELLEKQLAFREATEPYMKRQTERSLEDRFTALYIEMMKKKLEFIEAIEPFKADQENARRG